MKEFLITMGLAFTFLPTISMGIQALIREWKGHGMCNSIANYPVTMLWLAIIGVIMIIVGATQ